MMERYKKYFARPKVTGFGPKSAFFVTLLIYFGSQLFAGILIGLYFAMQGKTTEQAVQTINNSVTSQFIFILIVEIVSLVALYLFVRYRSISLSDLGLKKPSLNNLLFALPTFAVYFAVLIVLLSVLKPLLPGLDFEQEQQIGFDSARGAALVLVFISLVILPALVEEILVRGFLYGGFRKSFNKKTAALLASFIFGIAHLQLGSGEPPLWVAAIDTFVLSIALIWLREKTGNIWAGVGVHMIKNTLAFLSIFVFGAFF